MANKPSVSPKKNRDNTPKKKERKNRSKKHYRSKLWPVCQGRQQEAAGLYPIHRLDSGNELGEALICCHESEEIHKIGI